MTPTDRFLAALRSHGHEPKPAGDGRVCRCPAHADTHPSLSIGVGDEGRVLVKCHAGCTAEAIVGAIGLTMRDLMPPANGSRMPGCRTRRTSSKKPRALPKTQGGEGGHIPSDDAASVQHPGGCRLADYAAAKRLPVEFLQRLGLSEFTYSNMPAVRIPYPAPGGEAGPVRFRTAMHGPDRFCWKSGSKITLYGLDRLDLARRKGFVVIVEGESDTHTLWLHNEPAVGVAGASNWRDDRDAPHLAGIGTIYLVREPDVGGDSLLARLSKSPLRDRIRVVRLDGHKDPSSLHVDDPQRFEERWEAAKLAAVPLSEEIGREAERRRAELAESAAGLIRAPNILALFAADLERSGVVGESRAGKLLYLTITSRILDRQNSVAVKAASSAGKSITVKKTLDFFPASSYYALSAMSERALAYSEEPMKHRTLVIYEAAGLGSEFATYLLRSLLSEGCIRYETVERTAKGMRPRLIVREGPTNLIVTTTAVRLHAENETRLLSVPVTDTREQTAAILRRMASGLSAVIEYAPWHALQDYLASGGNRVVIPFAGDVAERIPPIAVRLRRDFGAVLSLIEAHALLHQGTRARDREGRIIATLADYAAVRELVADIIADGIGAGVPKSVRETVRVARDLIAGTDQELGVGEVAAKLRLDKSAASRRIHAAIDAGYLENREDRRGRPARIVLAEAMPDDQQILPPVEVLQGCSEDAGDTPPPGPGGGTP